MKRMLVLMLVFMVIVVGTPRFPQASDTITIQDALERTVTLPQAPQRIVSLSPSITELIFYMGLQDRLVAVDSISYNDTYYNISSYCRSHGLVDVGGYWWSAIRIEDILSVEPDLVLADKGAHVKLLELFMDYNITVVYLNAGASRSIEDIYHDAGIIAEIFGLEYKVHELITEIENSLRNARNKLGELAGRKILVVVGMYNGIWVAGKSTYIDDVLNRLGLENVAQVIGWKAVSIEEIAGWNPDIILVTQMGIDNETLKQAGIYDTGAKVIILDEETTDAISRPGPLIVRLPELLVKTLSGLVEETTTTTPDHGRLFPETSSGLAEETTTTTSNPGKQFPDTYAMLLYTVLSFIVGLGAGYIIYRKMS